MTPELEALTTSVRQKLPATAVVHGRDGGKRYELNVRHAGHWYVLLVRKTELPTDAGRARVAAFLAEVQSPGDRGKTDSLGMARGFARHEWDRERRAERDRERRRA